MIAPIGFLWLVVAGTIVLVLLMTLKARRKAKETETQPKLNEATRTAPSEEGSKIRSR